METGHQFAHRKSADPGFDRDPDRPDDWGRYFRWFEGGISTSPTAVRLLMKYGTEPSAGTTSAP